MRWIYINLFLILRLDLRINGEETMDAFINDLVTTFKLVSPTILYNNDYEIPEICYASQWVLCLSSNQHENYLQLLPDNPESSRESENDDKQI